jgi:hypothetical protein
MRREKIESVLEKHSARLMAINGVAGTAIGICQGEPCIKVYVVRKNPELLRQVPTTLEGYAVSIEESGKFRALSTC